MFFQDFSIDDRREPAFFTPRFLICFWWKVAFSGGLRARCAAPLAVPLH